MKPNISLAISKELDYIFDAFEKGKSDAVLSNYVKDSGYDNLKDFYADKLSFILKSLKIETFETQSSLITQANEFVESSKPIVLYNIHSDEHYIILPNDTDDFIISTSNKKSIKTVKIEANEAKDTIVSADGDLRLCIILPTFTGINCEWFLRKMKKYLEKYYFNIEICNGNCIKIKGDPVIHGMQAERNSMRCMMFTISFVDPSTILKNSNNVKETNWFIDHNVISPEEFKNKVISWIN